MRLTNDLGDAARDAAAALALTWAPGIGRDRERVVNRIDEPFLSENTPVEVWGADTGAGTPTAVLRLGEIPEALALALVAGLGGFDPRDYLGLMPTGRGKHDPYRAENAELVRRWRLDWLIADIGGRRPLPPVASPSWWAN